MTDYFEIGTILKPQGIRGEVKVEIYTDDTMRLIKLKSVYFKSDGTYIEKVIDKTRVDAKFAYIKFKGIDDRNDAEYLRGKNIYINRENAGILPEGSYYIADQIGMKVFDDSNELLGELSDIMQTGSKDVYVVALKEGGTLSFPSVDGVIITRNIETAEMKIDSQKISEVGIYDF